MLTLKYNPASMRYDCYKGSKYITTLTCGTRFNLYCDDEGMLVAGRIEYHSIYGDYFIGDDEISIMYLYSGLEGVLQ